MGSMCGLYSAIVDNFKKKPDMLLMSKLPSIFNFLPHIENAKHISEYDNSREYDLVINVDVASKDRMFESEMFFSRAKKTVNIDHHKTNEFYADLNYVDIGASSAGELLYSIVQKLGWKVSKEAAVCLYTAILTDTGSFRFNNTTSKTFEAASELVELGVKPSEIYKYCYESNSRNFTLFQAYCLNKAEFLDDIKTSYVIVYKKDMEKFNLQEDCTEGLAEKLRAIDTVEISFLVKQLSGNLSKISMRSEKVDVSKICSKFGGGGHTLAAGCLIKSSAKDAAKKILDEIKNVEI